MLEDFRWDASSFVIHLELDDTPAPAASLQMNHSQSLVSAGLQAEYNLSRLLSSELYFNAYSFCLRPGWSHQGWDRPGVGETPLGLIFHNDLIFSVENY